jgi:hypothetical protein
MAYGEALAQNPAYPNLQKIQGAILTVCGGSLAEILATSQLSSVAAQKSERAKLLGFTDAESYQEILEPHIKLDPLKFATPSGQANVLMFSSLNDVVVPTATQIQLWEAWGEPERQLFVTDHMWTIIQVYSLQAGKIHEFADNLLAD